MAERADSALRETISRLDRSVAALVGQYNSDKDAQTDWRAGAAWRLGNIEAQVAAVAKKCDDGFAEMRQAMQISQSAQSVATAQIGSRVQEIEIDRAKEQGQIRGGLAVIAAMLTAASALGSGLTFLFTWVSGHLK